MKNVQQVNYKEVVILNHVVLEITCDMFINKTSLDIFEQVAESMAIFIHKWLPSKTYTMQINKCMFNTSQSVDYHLR